MSVRRKNVFRKAMSKAKRGSKRAVIEVINVGIIPIRLTGAMVRVTGERIEDRGERRTTIGEPIGDRKMVWRGRAYKLIGKPIVGTGKLVSYPVLVWDDHKNNIKGRMDLEARMDGSGWRNAVVTKDEKFMPKGLSPNAMTFVPSNKNAVTEVEATRILMQDEKE